MFRPCWGKHQLESFTSDKLYHDKGNRIREWYFGTIEYCTREGCDYERFYGRRVPIHREILPAPDGYRGLDHRSENSEIVEQSSKISG